MDDQKNDHFPFYIAIIIFFGFLFFISLFFKTIDLETVKVIITAFVAWIGAIIGFYFGQKPVKEITGKLATVSAEKEVERLSDIDEMDTAFNDRIQKLEDRAKKLTDLINQL